MSAASKIETTTLPVAALELCDRVRVRKQRPKDSTDIVLEYAEAYGCGLIVEPLDVFREKGTERYIVADGEHRLLALQRNGAKDIEVRMHEGDEVDALDFAISCNQQHGLRRSKADKYHAFEQLMETPSLKTKYRTDSDLAEKIGVSVRTIHAYKAEWRKSPSESKAARRAKEKAREQAAQHTTPAKAEPAVLQVPNPPTPKEKPSEARTKPAEQKKPPAKSAETAWTKVDQQGADAISDALSILRKAWDDASLAARIHSRDEVQITLRGLA